MTKYVHLILDFIPGGYRAIDYKALCGADIRRQQWTSVASAESANYLIHICTKCEARIPMAKLAAMPL